MVFMPPQHGKSELTTRRLPPFILGKDKHKRIAVVSYAATPASLFNRDMQRIIDEEKYNEVFPNTYLNSSNVVSSAKGSFLRNSEVFEVMCESGKTPGFVKTIGIDGALTGSPVDVGIIDDPYKGRDEALSKNMNEAVWSMYVNVFLMRLHNRSQQLLVMTRWQEDDLAGRILKKAKPGEWKVVMFQAIKERDNLDDPRAMGEALWEDEHSKEEILQIKSLSRVTFDASYQQEPKPPKEVLVYPDWKRAKAFPDPQATFLCGDFGYSNDPTAVLEMQVVKGPRTKVYVKELVYNTRLSNKMIVEALRVLKVNIKKFSVWDSEDPKSIKDLNTLGMNAKGAVKGPGSLNLGINELRDCDIYVLPNSPNVEAELLAYQFRVIGGTITNEPIDKHNHALDAMRYGYTNRHLNGKLRI